MMDLRFILSPDQIDENCASLEQKLGEADHLFQTLENGVFGLTPERISHNRALSQLLQDSAALAYGLLQATAGTYHPRVQALAQRFARDYSYSDTDVDHGPALFGTPKALELRIA